MKIISNFKDYYDYLINQHGIDNHLVFDRNNKNVKIQSESSIYQKEAFSRRDYGLFYLQTYFMNKEEEKLYTSIHKSSSLFYFCGKFYTYTTHFFTDKKFVKTTKTDLKQADWSVMNEEILDYFNKNNIVSALIYAVDVDSKTYKSFFKVELNPKLAEIMRTKFTPEEVYQEIEMFLGKTKENVELVEVSNDQKIVKSGFDLKKSFRKQSKK